MGWIPVSVRVGPQPRGPGSQPVREFFAQSMAATTSWGTNPGIATVIYVGDSLVTTGADVRLQLGSFYFAGICRVDTETVGSNEGQLRRLEFLDYREYLKFDWTFGCYNRPDVRMVGGVRVKRYKHLLPLNFRRWGWTYTMEPLRGYEVLGYVLGARVRDGGTIGTPWTLDLTGNGLFPDGVLWMPLPCMDWTGGRRLDAALSEICERSGTVLTLQSSESDPYHLEWTRKGYGELPTFEGVDNISQALTLSGHPTNVIVVGGRNLYQVMGIKMEPDWARAWESFLVLEQFYDDVYERGIDPATKGSFKSIPNDAQQYIGRQRALALALEMTVGDYVRLRNSQVSGSGDRFADYKKFAGRSRMDMPCVLYIQMLVFRAFRPGNGRIVTQSGFEVSLGDATLVDRLLCKVRHDPVTGEMTAYPDEPADGNGYVVTKGYRVGADMFRSIRSDQLQNLLMDGEKWAWSTVGFQIDDSGDGNRFIIMDEPVVTSSNLFARVGNHLVVNAGGTVDQPLVYASLVFEADVFQYGKARYANVGRDHVENVPELHGEYVAGDNGVAEIPHANGKGVYETADEIATGLLERQYIVYAGSLKHIWDGESDIRTFGTRLSSTVDRVTVRTSPTEGFYELVDLTSERTRDSFEPERELDRRTLQNSLFPGQIELRERAEDARRVAAMFRQLPQAGKLLSMILSGNLTGDQPMRMMWFGNARSAAVAVGTPVRGREGSRVGTYPADVAKEDTEFLGVTVRENESAVKPFLVQVTGLALIRVKGPGKVGDSVGLTNGESDQPHGDWLVVNGDPGVGQLREAIEGEEVKLVRVAMGSGGGGTVRVSLCDPFTNVFELYDLVGRKVTEEEGKAEGT